MRPTARADALLGRLAEALGHPVEIFFAEVGPEAAPDREPIATLELLRLWSALREPRSRQRVLAVARQEARALRETRADDAGPR
ncbi:hypothetical protein [Methylobacterium sp. P5_C11]